MVIASIHELPISKVATLCRPHGLSNSLICNGQSGSLIETRTRERDWEGGRESGRKRWCLGQLGYRVSLGVSNCGRALVASRLSGWMGPNFRVRPRAHSTGSMGRIPLFSLSGPDNCWYTPSRGSPCWSLGPSPSGGSSQFWLAWGLCTVLLLPVHPPSQCPGPSASAVASHGALPWSCPALPGYALPCHALPCPGFPSPTWKVPARPPLPK